MKQRSFCTIALVSITVGFVACLTTTATAQDFNKQLRKAILENHYVPVIPAITGPEPGYLVTSCNQGLARFEPNPNGPLAPDKLKAVGMTSAQVDLSQKLTFETFISNITQALTGNISASGDVSKTLSLKQISANGQTLTILPNAIADDTKVQAEFNKQKQVGCKLLIVQSVYTTSDLDIEVNTTADVAGGMTMGGAPVKSCADTQAQGRGASAAVCVKDHTHLTLTMPTPMVFAVSVVQMIGPGLTKAVKLKGLGAINLLPTQEIFLQK